MAPGEAKKELPDWVIPANGEVDDLSRDVFELAVKSGINLEKDEKTSKFKVTGVTVVKGGQSRDPLDVTK